VTCTAATRKQVIHVAGGVAGDIPMLLALFC